MVRCWYDVLGWSLKHHAKEPYKSLVKANLEVEAQRLPSSLVEVKLPVNRHALVRGHEAEDTAMSTARLNLGDHHKTWP